MCTYLQTNPKLVLKFSFELIFSLLQVLLAGIQFFGNSPFSFSGGVFAPPPHFSINFGTFSNFCFLLGVPLVLLLRMKVSGLGTGLRLARWWLSA